MSTADTDRPVALVTGGAAGIGWAVCRRLARDGYRIVLADIDAAEAQQRVGELGPLHVALEVDLTDAASAADLPARAAAAFGRLDVVVNNAGMTDTSGKSLIDLPAERFDRLVALNLAAVEQICASAPQVMARGGRIVNLASGAAFRPLALRGPYSATKAGVVELTRIMGAAYARNGLSVVAIAPGYTRTPLVEALQKAGRVDLKAVAATITLGRIAEPEDIANAVAFAASTGARALSGQTLRVDGGSFGPAPHDTAPAKGSGTGAQIAVFGGLQLPGAVQLSGHEQLGTLDRLSAVIDASGLSGDRSSAEMLQQTRRMALACAEAPNRAADFSLLFVSSAAGSASRVGQAAQAMLGRTLALEWARSGLRVNAIGWQGRDVSDLAPLCSFLAGPDAALITGECLQAG